MGLETAIIGLIRGGKAGGQQRMQFNGYGDQLVNMGGVPRMAEAARRGTEWSTMSTAAVGALVARPSTTAAFEIYNNTPGRVMVVDRLFAHWLVSSTTALGSGAGIYAMVGPQVAPTDAALAINSPTGLPAQVKTVLTAASQTVVDNGWFPYGSSMAKTSAGGAVVPMGILEALVEGRILVRYQHALCLHTVSGYTADTFTHGASWFWENDDDFPIV